MELQSPSGVAWSRCVRTAAKSAVSECRVHYVTVGSIAAVYVKLRVSQVEKLTNEWAQRSVVMTFNPLDFIKDRMYTMLGTWISIVPAPPLGVYTGA